MESHAKALFKNIIWLLPSSSPADAFAHFPQGLSRQDIGPKSCQPPSHGASDWIP